MAPGCYEQLKEDSATLNVIKNCTNHTSETSLEKSRENNSIPLPSTPPPPHSIYNSNTFHNTSSTSFTSSSFSSKSSSSSYSSLNSNYSSSSKTVDMFDSFEILEQTIMKQKRLARIKNSDLRMKILLKRTFDLVCEIMDHENGFDDDKCGEEEDEDLQEESIKKETKDKKQITEENDKESDDEDDDSDKDSDESSSSSDDESDKSSDEDDDDDDDDEDSDDEIDDESKKLRKCLKIYELDQLIPKDSLSLSNTELKSHEYVSKTTILNNESSNNNVQVTEESINVITPHSNNMDSYTTDVNNNEEILNESDKISFDLYLNFLSNSNEDFSILLNVDQFSINTLNNQRVDLGVTSESGSNDCQQNIDLTNSSIIDQNFQSLSDTSPTSEKSKDFFQDDLYLNTHFYSNENFKFSNNDECIQSETIYSDNKSTSSLVKQEAAQVPLSNQQALKRKYTNDSTDLQLVNNCKQARIKRRSSNDDDDEQEEEEVYETSDSDENVYLNDQQVNTFQLANQSNLVDESDCYLFQNLTNSLKRNSNSMVEPFSTKRTKYFD